MKEMGEDTLADIFLVSELILEDGTAEVEIEARKCEEPKCPRCWRQGHGVGSTREHSELCVRCADVVKKLALDDGEGS